MSLILSRGCEYGLQAVLFLAARSDDKPVLLRDISCALDIPPHFLGKILQQLCRSNLLASRKGKSGGFSLARSAEKISLYDVVEVIDGPDVLEACILGFPACRDGNPCPLHSQWKKAKGVIVEMLRNRNIRELSRGRGLDFGRLKRERLPATREGRGRSPILRWALNTI